MNPRDVFNARANYENAVKSGTQQSMAFLKTIEDQLKQHADQLQVPQESSLNSAENADEKGWVKSSYWDGPVLWTKLIRVPFQGKCTAVVAA